MVRTLFLLLSPALVAASCSRSPSEPGASGDPPPGVAASSTPTAAVSARPVPHPSIPGAEPSRPGALALKWDDPPRWQRRPPSTQMRAAEYRIPKAGTDGEDGECFVITFGPGQGGSVDDNIERWVKQLQPTSTAVERTTRTVHGMKVTRVEVGGTYTPMAMPSMPPAGPARPGWRLVGDIVEAPSGAWFFKMTGPDATAKAAGRELDALIDSIRSS